MSGLRTVFNTDLVEPNLAVLVCLKRRIGSDEKLAQAIRGKDGRDFKLDAFLEKFMPAFALVGFYVGGRKFCHAEWSWGEGDMADCVTTNVAMEGSVGFSETLKMENNESLGYFYTRVADTMGEWITGYAVTFGEKIRKEIAEEKDKGNDDDDLPF